MEIGEKPKVAEARRPGRRFAEDKCRPVMLKVGSSPTATQIVNKRRKLKDTTNFRTVYIAPDRTAAEKVEKRNLITRRKQEQEQNQTVAAAVRELRRQETVFKCGIFSK